jgi:hypothetical protein
LGPLLFLIYIDDLPLVLNKISTRVLFADDTSIIIIVLDPLIFQDKLTEIFNILNLWFSTNLSLNFSKTHYIKFSTKNLYDQFSRIIIASGNNEISESCYTKFLGINIVNTLSWKRHIDQLLPKLNTAWYAIRTLKPYLSRETLLMVYYAYFHSILNFGIIIWGNSSCAISIFRVQKRVLRIMTDTGSRNSCRQLFKTLRILPLQSQYIYSLLCFVLNNIES